MNHPVPRKQGLPEFLLATIGQRIHAVDVVASCDLYQAQLREIGLLTHELSIDAKVFVTDQVRSD
jgi:hypothetical protein